MNEEGKRLETTKEIQSPWKRFWKDYGDIFITMAAVFITFKFIFQLAWVPTGSMETTLPTKSLLIGWRAPFVVADPAPDYGDVITFWSEELDEVLVKRVIGLPGDTITYDGEGFVYRNGEKLDEPYLTSAGITYCDKEFTVPDGCFFVMGDNRGGSYDARSWGMPYITMDNIQARTLVCISLGKTHAWQGVHIIAK